MHSAEPIIKRLTSLIPGIIVSRNQQWRNQQWVLLLVVLVVLAACSSPSTLRRTTNTELNRVISTAEDLIGTSYCSRGTTPDCFDCSGFTSWCFIRGGITLPRSSKEQFAAGKPIDVLQPGDLVFFITFGSDVSHVGIYAGDNTFVHSSTSKGVIVSSMHEPYWRTRFVGARRIFEQ